MDQTEQISIRPFEALGSKFALNWRTHLLFAVPAMSSGLFNDFSRLGGPAASWILLTAIGFATTVMTIELSLQLVERFGRRPKALVAFGILMTAGFARGLVNFYAGGLLGIVPQSDFLYRLLGAPLYVVSTYIIFNALITSYLEQRETERQLTRETATLRQSRILFQEEIQRLKLERRSKVKELITPSLWEISKRLRDAKLQGDTGSLVQAIRQANENVVRPLSHNLSKSFDTPTISNIQPVGRLGRLALPKRVTLGRSFSVTMLLVFSVALGYSTQALQFGFVTAITNVVVGGSYFAFVTYLLKTLTSRLEHPTWLGFSLTFPLGMLVGLSSRWLLEVETLTFGEIFPLQAGVFFALSYPSIYIIAVTQVQRKRNLAELERVVQDLRILNAQLRQQVWLDQKLLATELHGSVQATLHATALSLANNKKASVADLDKVMQSVQSVVDRLGEAAYLEGESFDQVLEDIAVVWEDVCQIKYVITAEASALLEGDPKAARSAIEVVRETITNAIKHNSAKHVNVELSVDELLLKLKISNPGELSLAKEAGLGSEIMAELTYQHNLEQVGDQVVLTALIPQSLAVEQ